MAETLAENCTICARAARRSHGGVMVCPRCDLNEFPTHPPTPKIMPNRRPPVTGSPESQHG